MKRMICFLLGIVFIGCTACVSSSREKSNSQNDEPFVVALPVKDYPMADTVESMTKQSTYVVVGEFTELDSKWNMMRDINNPELESNDNYAEGHLYRFKVDDVLKGTLEKTEILVNQEYSEIVTYTESDRVIENGIVKKEATWSKDYQIEVKNERYFEPEIGTKYMLFLDKGTYYYGACEPFVINISTETPYICSNSINRDSDDTDNFETVIVDGREILIISSRVYVDDFVAGMSTGDIFAVVKGSAVSDTTFGTLIGPRDSVTGVSIILEPLLSGNVCVFTNDKECEAILDILYNANIGSFEEPTDSYIEGSVVPLLISTDSEDYTVDIINSTDAQYIRIKTGSIELGNTEQQLKKVPANTFDFAALNTLVGNILRNDSDPEYSGVVTVGSTSTSIIKAHSAYAKSYLDRAAQNGTDTADDSITYDVEFSINGIIYSINSESGHFCKDENGAKIYAQLESVDLMQLKTRLSI